ncbi:hypothetical protein M6B38_206485 [Iris pallida]|uniref:Uncharacterized protein n=1 Tax=Iris pallida TaxID=29817 RepID=A0AAX6E6K2_IRIPA|nr:hypothetical protein M6B38_206485 [Iris pallida]
MKKKNKKMKKEVQKIEADDYRPRRGCRSTKDGVDPALIWLLAAEDGGFRRLGDGRCLGWLSEETVAPRLSRSRFDLHDNTVSSSSTRFEIQHCSRGSARGSRPLQSIGKSFDVQTSTFQETSMN